MAFIGTLRDKMGKWVVGFVFIAILAFVVNDVFSGNSSILNWGKNSVGSIAGHDVSNEEYQNAVEERVLSYRANNGREPGTVEMTTIRQQAWDLLIARYAIEGEYDKIGVAVTEDELLDLVQGKNVDQNIKQAPIFQNQQTGQFDAALVTNYLRNLNPQEAEQWKIFEKELKASRARLKYENLLIKSVYSTKHEAEQDYHLQTDVAEVKYLYVPYYTADTLAKPTDADFTAYYNKNRERFHTEESVSIKYVSFPVVPSAEDTLEVTQSFERDLDVLKTGTNDSIYVSTLLEGKFEKYNSGNLPAFINTDSLIEGNIIGPLLSEGNLTLAKIIAVTTDTTYAARASHILIRPVGTTDAAKAEAKVKAQQILKDLKGGADFAQKAQEFGSDGTRSQGGDLGWFSTGDMVKPFQDAVFAATKTGLLNDVVETDFGYHIISVTNVKTNKAYKIALIQRSITASDNTKYAISNSAENFKEEAKELGFEQAAQKSGILINEAKNLLAADRRISTLGDAREIITWAFRDGSKNDISKVYELEDLVVVAMVSEKVDAGYKTLNSVKDEITPAVKNEVVASLLVKKLAPLKGTLEDIASAYGTDARVYTSSDLKLSSNNLPNVGFEPKAIGVAFSLENGQRSQPFAGETGVIIVELQNKTIAPALNSYQAYKEGLEQGLLNRNISGIADAIKEKSSIKDKRYRFY